MSRRILAVLAALLLALFGTGAMFAYVSRADDRALEGQEAVKVLMAAKDIPAGTSAKEAEEQGLLKTDALPRKAVPVDALEKVGADVEKLVASSTIARGEVLTRGRFATKVTAAGGLSVPSGKVAVSVELSHPAHVSEFLRAGSDIMVFDTFNVQEAKADDSPAGDHLQDRHEYTRATRVLLPKVTVLAVGDATASSTPEDTKNKDTSADTTTSTIVTVAVSPEDAAKLVHGVHTGTLHLALLAGDTKAKVGDGVNDRNLFG